MSIVINVNKAKNIAHGVRRSARAAEFAPLDLKVTIPSEAVAAEAARQAVREKYAAIQAEIEAAQTPEQIKAALGVV